MPQFSDDVQLLDSSGQVIISLYGRSKVHHAGLQAGGSAYSGHLMLSDSKGHLRVGLNSNHGSLNLWREPKPGEEMQPAKALVIHASSDGALTLSLDGGSTIRLDGARGDIWLGGNGTRGDIMLFRKDGDNKTVADASIRLDGEAGDIILQNADCAEEFDADGPAEPGSIMVIGKDGKLQQSREGYDRGVVGVVSGLGKFRPGIVLDRRPMAPRRLPVAVVGKVYCKVDANLGPIEEGDLLTTAEGRIGHAMKAFDPHRAFGAVLGKALRSHSDGLGVIPILVALQ